MRFIYSALLGLSLSCATLPAFAQEADENNEPVTSPKVDLPNDVESDGAFRYRIGLDLPKFRGLVPNISLRYSSANKGRGGPDATMGVGWSLSGLSSIDRVSTGLGAPGYAHKDDIFRLDGTALLACKDASATAPWPFPGWAYPEAFHTTEPSASCSGGGHMATQQETYKRVRRFENDYHTASWFEVTRPDGTIYIYRSVGELAGETGAAGDAHFGPAFKRLWLLSEIRDQQATPNVVTVAYDFAPRADGYAHRVKSLTYADYAVEFHYEAQTNPMATYSVARSGLFGRQFHRLTSVTVKDGDTQVRGWDFDYTTSALTGSSLLVSVTQYGSDYVLAGSEITGGTALPATRFTYSDDAYSLTDQLYPGHTFNTSAATWDFNDDQRQDLIVKTLEAQPIDNDEGPDTPGYYFRGGHYGFDGDRNLTVLPDNFMPIDPVTVDGRALAGFNEFWSSPGPEGGKYVTRPVYVRTDTVQERENDDWVWRSQPIFELHLQRINADGSIASSIAFEPRSRTPKIYSYPNTPSPSQTSSYSSVQLFPDQAFELFLKVYHPNPSNDVPLIMGNRFFSITDNGEPHEHTINTSEPIEGMPVDIDGDGITEFVNTYKKPNLAPFFPPLPYYFQPRIYNFDGSSFSKTNAPALQDSSNCGFIGGIVNGPTVYGDVNGDGMSDMVRYLPLKEYPDQVCVALSNGTSFDQFKVWAIPSNYLREGPSKFTITDVNDDGLGDLVVSKLRTPDDGRVIAYQGVLRSRSLTPSSVSVFLSTGHSFLTSAQANAKAYVTLGDFDGDGRVDFASMRGSHISGYDYRVGARIYWGPSFSPNMLTSISTSEGGLVGVSYAPSSDYADNLVPGVSQVVSSITRDDGRGNVRATKYTYVGSRYDYERRKPLGFRTVSAQLEPIEGEEVGPTIVTVYKNTHPAEYGLVKSRTVMVGGTTTYEMKINDWDVQAVGNGPWRATKTGERVAVRYGSEMIESAKSYTYTPFGQPLVTVDYGFTQGGNNIAGGDDVTVTLAYEPNLSAYVVDRPTRKVVQTGAVSSGAQNTWLSAEFYHYDDAASHAVAPVRGNLSKVRRWSGDTNTLDARVEASFTHDAWGNVLTETNARGATTTHSYDATRHLFKEGSTNALGHSGSTVWNTGCQVPASQTDANGRVTTITYDALCREKELTQPNGHITRTYYTNLGNPQSQYIQKSARSSSATSGSFWSVSREYFDGFGQVWKAVAPGATSNVGTSGIVELRGYDARGNLAWTSLPRTWAEGHSVTDAQRTRFRYDPLNRPVQTLFADGTEAQTEYLPGLVGRWGPLTKVPRIRQRDAHCFDDVAATLCGDRSAFYDAAGRLVRSDRYDVNQTDVGGVGMFRSEGFTYDGLGRLIRVNAPEGGNWVYTYDAFGNRLTANDPGLGNWTMTYDENGNLLEQTDAKGQVISFAYDALDRVTLKRVGTGASRVDTTYDYDTGNSDQTFYNVGQLTKQQLWQNGGYVHTIETDYAIGGQPDRVIHRLDGRSYFLRYSYNRAGNLLDMRLPNTPNSTGTGWTGVFAYDAANRVVSWGTGVTSVSYDLWGNPTETVLGNGVRETAEYHPQRGWPTRLSAFAPDNTRFLDTAYTRSATGRITRVDTEKPEGDVDYSYDYAGRLLSSTNFSGQAGFDQSFSYDAAGRMRSNSQVGSYVYQTGGPLHAPDQLQLAGGGTTSLSYDANGNMLTGLDGKVMAYDGENRPLSVTHAGKTTTYVYGADGTRLKKIENVGTPEETTTVYIAQSEIRGFRSGAEEIISYPIPAVRVMNGTTVGYLHRDALSSVRAVTGPDGAVDESAIYRPFGEQHEQIQDLSAPAETKGFIGERFDADAGLQYLNARYYDPKLAIFIQPDWFEVTKPGVGTNRYSYSFNDPINLMDPGGNEVYGEGFTDKERDRLEKDFEAARERLRTEKDNTADILDAIKKGTNPTDLHPETYLGIKRAFQTRDPLTKRQVQRHYDRIDKVLTRIGELGSGVEVQRYDGFLTSVGGSASAAYSRKGPGEMEIADRYFHGRPGEISFLPSDGGYTVTHEMGHSALGLSDRLPYRARDYVDNVDIFKRDNAPVRGYRARGVELAERYGMRNHNDTFICSLGFKC